MAANKKDISELEELDVIEARELNVGNAFHAFRFRIVDKIDPETQALLNKAAKALGMNPRDFNEIIESEAIEDNAYANFARGVLAALKANKAS